MLLKINKYKGYKTLKNNNKTNYKPNTKILKKREVNDIPKLM